ncbi:MAG: hypothetical protein ABJ237_16205 [Parasphingorhabdus sp.]
MSGCVLTNERIKPPTAKELKKVIKQGQDADYQWMIETETLPVFNYIEKVTFHSCKRRKEPNHFYCRVGWRSASSKRSNRLNLVVENRSGEWWEVYPEVEN